MRAGSGTQSSASGRQSSGHDGVHPIGGAGCADGSITQAQNSGTGTGEPIGGDDRDVTKAPWFDPVSDDAFSDCPGGVCPVPWAVKEEAPVLQGDNVNHPTHYTDGGIECIEAIEAALTTEEFRGYCKGNIQKYVWRERMKGGTESLKKAQWYLDRLIELDESQKG